MIKPITDPDWYVVSAELAAEVNNSPGLRWKKNRWEIHRSQLPLIKDDLEVSRLLDSTVDLNARTKRDALTEPLGFKLRTHQHVGVEFMAKRRGSLIADSMRTGKTAQVVVTAQETPGSFVVFCPKMVREVWLSWLVRRYPGIEVNKDIAVLQGKTITKEDLSKPFIIGHYDIIKYWQSVGSSSNKLGTLVFDEAHILSKKDSHRAIAANFVASRAQKVVALTGTPLWNKPTGLWNILNLLAQEGWGSHFDFCMRFCDPEPSAYGWKFKGASNTEELKCRLTEVMLHRTLNDVMDVPEISRDVLICDLTPEERLDIDVAAEDLKKADTIHNAIGSLSRYRQILGKIKVKTAVEAAEKVVENGEPVVIWTWHKEVSKLIAAKLKKYGTYIIDGGTSDKKREQYLAEWRSNCGKVLIISISCGQTGLDLSHARLAIFAEIDFTPATVAQAEMRIFSPLRPMHVSYVVVDHPVDRQIILALRVKLEVSDQMAVPAAESAIEVLSQAFAGNGKLPDGDLDRLMRMMMEDNYI